MKIKTVINSKGEQQGSCVEIPVEGGGGALGMHAVQNLTSLIGGLDEKKTIKEITVHWYIICGFALCCHACGFLTEKSMDELMYTVEEIANDKLTAAKE